MLDSDKFPTMDSIFFDMEVMGLAPMTADGIRRAVDAGYDIRWANDAYQVRKDKNGEYLIVCLNNDNCIGLTARDGVTLNGNPENFYVKK